MNVREAADLLGVAPDTLRRWARQGLIAVRRPAGEPVFARDELEQWAKSHGLSLHEETARPSGAQAAAGHGIAGAVGRGGILRGLGGGTREGVLEELVRRLPGSMQVDRELLLEHLRDREALSSTGLGHGVALPHPRTPNRAFASEPVVVIGFLEQPVDWKAIDAEPVHTLFLLLSPSPAQHLQTLSKVAFLLRDSGFCEMLASHPEDAPLFQALAEREPAAQ